MLWRYSNDELVRLCIHALACVVLLTLAACGESSQDAYSRGFQNGYDAAKIDESAAREEGRQTGYKQGYETARPPNGVMPPPGGWLVVSTVAMILGMAKVVLSLVVFTIAIIIQSASWPERMAKIIATSLAVILVFWLSSGITVGFSRPIYALILAPGGTSPLTKLAIGLAAAVGMWLLLWALDFLVSSSKGHVYLQTLYVVLSTAIVTILVPTFLSLRDTPNVFGYRVFDLAVGIVLGGVCWIVQRLLIEAEQHRQRRLTEVREREERHALARNPTRSVSLRSGVRGDRKP